MTKNIVIFIFASALIAGGVFIYKEMKDKKEEGEELGVDGQVLPTVDYQFIEKMPDLRANLSELVIN